MRDAKIENGNVVINAYGGKPTIFPVEVLEAVLALPNRWQLNDALWFYQVTKRSEEWYWADVETLLGKDLDRYVVHYYVSNWEDSAWERNDTARAMVEFSAPEGERVTYIFSDEVEPDKDDLWGMTFTPGDNVLVVKMGDAEYEAMAEQRAADKAEMLAEELAE